MRWQVEEPAQEVRRLQHCINDLVGVLSLSAIWRGSEPEHIVQTLLDVLLKMLTLDFAYARLNQFGAIQTEMLRIAEDCNLNLSPEELRTILGSFFSSEAHTLPRVRSRLGDDETSIFPVPLGIQGESGVLVLGSSRVGFPEKTESLLLSVAANQASIGLQEARIIVEQKRIATELERRVAERTEELTAANAELQLLVGLLQHLPVSAWMLKPDGTPDFVNQVWLEFAGQTLDFVRSHPEAWMTVVHPEDREFAARSFWEGVHSGQDFAFETRSLRAKDGTYRWHLQQAVVFRDAEGKVLRFVGTTTDIDDQKRAQEELRSGERKLAAIINTIPTTAWTARPNGYCDFLNQVWLDYAGLAAEQAQGWGWAEAIHPDDRKQLVAVWQSCLASGTPVDTEARIRRFDGSFRWFLIRANPLRDESGNILKWYGTCIDIEDRKQAEEALRERELDARSLLETMPGLLARLSPDGTPEIVNRPLLQYFGKTVGELKNWKMNDAIHHDDLVRTIEVFVSGVSSGQPFDYQYRLRRFDGMYRWFQARVVPARNAEGRIVHWNALVTDINERKHAEEELRVAQSELTRVMRVMTMGQLTASIAHEVNQPLSGIITNAGTCLRMLDATPPNLDGARETARRTIRDGHRAAEVITRLRTLYSKKDPALEAMDLNEAAQEVTALLSSEIQRNGVILRQEFANDLPPALGDRIQLQQVILNLLRNAADAMSSIDDRPRGLLLRTERDGNHVRLSVKDSGVGLTPQAADKIFEAFYTTKTDGMGIGLSISRSIIEAHHGRLWATRNDGPGSTFSFSIPCMYDSTADTETRLKRANL